MAPASNEEQFKFLISCIRYSNNGKVDFGQVARECAIVSKGAAAKRYERLMRNHGIAHSSNGAIKPSRKRKDDDETAAAKKQRKMEAFDNEQAIADDIEPSFFDIVKSDPDSKQNVQVKEELMANNQNDVDDLYLADPPISEPSFDNLAQTSISQDNLERTFHFDFNAGNYTSLYEPPYVSHLDTSYMPGFRSYNQATYAAQDTSSFFPQNYTIEKSLSFPSIVPQISEAPVKQENELIVLE